MDESISPFVRYIYNSLTVEGWLRCKQNVYSYSIRDKKTRTFTSFFPSFCTLDMYHCPLILTLTLILACWTVSWCVREPSSQATLTWLHCRAEMWGSQRHVGVRWHSHSPNIQPKVEAFEGLLKCVYNKIMLTSLKPFHYSSGIAINPCETY